jgi:prepilin-type N-terminal cleavage/methylation domain-containing protein
MQMMAASSKHGFTLIELSIVLLIIGLIVGGVLAGQNLIFAAGVRATISQIGNYNTAVNTFRTKYGALPGDLNSGTATTFGFKARGSQAGEGDGNGVIEGVWQNAAGSDYGYIDCAGETAMFWVDLTTANGLNVNLIDGSFSTATPTTIPGSDITTTSTPNIASYLPQAKLGQGNYVYVWSGGYNATLASGDNTNYFGISAVSLIAASSYACNLASTPGLTVAQAYSMDNKIDDGFPQSGNVTAMYVNGDGNLQGIYWAGTVGTGATSGSPTTCYDNGGNGGAAQNYSLAQNGGTGVNCALSFRFQ